MRRIVLLVFAVLLGGGIVLACKDTLTEPTQALAPSYAERRNWLLDFQQMPESAAVGLRLSPAVQVAFTDSEGRVRQNASFPVELQLAQNTANASLHGTTTRTAVGGIASFPNVWIDQPGIFRLVATAKNVAPITSTPVVVVASDSVAPVDSIVAVVVRPAQVQLDSSAQQRFCQFYKFASGRKINPVVPTTAYCDSLFTVYQGQP